MSGTQDAQIDALQTQVADLVAALATQSARIDGNQLAMNTV